MDGDGEMERTLTLGGQGFVIWIYDETLDGASLLQEDGILVAEGEEGYVGRAEGV